MASTSSTPAAAPAPSATPTTATPAASGSGLDSGAKVVSKPTSAADSKQTPTEAKAPAQAAPETVTIKGKTYNAADLEAALATHSTVDQALKAVAQKEASIKERDAAFASGDKTKIMEALRKAGVPKEALAAMAEDVLLAEVQEAEMTPEQRELAQLKAEKAERAAAEKLREEAEKAKATEAQVAQFQAAMQEQFVSAMNEVGVPRTPETVIQMTQVMMDALDAGFQLDPKEAATLVRAKTFESTRPVFEGMSAAQLRDALGPKVVEALVKDYTASLQAQTSKAPDGPAVRRSATPKEPSKPASLSDLINSKISSSRR